MYVVVEPWNVLLLCGENLCPQEITQQPKTDLPLYSSFVYGDQSSESTGSQIDLSVAGLGDLFICFVSKIRFCIWTKSLGFSFFFFWQVGGQRVLAFSVLEFCVYLCDFFRLFESLGFVFSFGGRFAFPRVLGFFRVWGISGQRICCSTSSTRAMRSSCSHCLTMMGSPCPLCWSGLMRTVAQGLLLCSRIRPP